MLDSDTSAMTSASFVQVGDEPLIVVAAFIIPSVTSTNPSRLHAKPENGPMGHGLISRARSVSWKRNQRGMGLVYERRCNELYFILVNLLMARYVCYTPTGSFSIRRFAPGNNMRLIICACTRNALLLLLGCFSSVSGAT